MTIKQPTTPEIESRPLNEYTQAEIRQALLQTMCTMPGKVVSFDGTRATVQPLFKAVLTPETDAISLPEIVDVPVCFPVSSGGTSYITIPVKPGDTGTLTFFDRDMAAWLYGDGGEKEPESFRIHDLTDASFTPNLTPFSKAIGASTDNLDVVNDSMSITLYPEGKIKIEGASKEMVSVLSGALGNIEAASNSILDLLNGIAGATIPPTGGVLSALYAAYAVDYPLVIADISKIGDSKDDLDTLKKV